MGFLCKDMEVMWKHLNSGVSRERFGLAGWSASIYARPKDRTAAELQTIGYTKTSHDEQDSRLESHLRSRRAKPLAVIHLCLH